MTPAQCVCVFVCVCVRVLCTACVSEDLLPLRTVVDREVETLEDCSRRPPLKRAQRTLLLDGREVAEPLLEWGTERCWKTGTDSNIARDFLFRGLYYPQLVRMLKSFPSVRR